MGPSAGQGPCRGEQARHIEEGHMTHGHGVFGFDDLPHAHDPIMDAHHGLPIDLHLDLVTQHEHGTIGGLPVDIHHDSFTGHDHGTIGDVPIDMHHNPVTGHEHGTIGDVPIDMHHDP